MFKKIEINKNYSIDENGNVIGDPIIGAAPDMYREAVEKALG